MPKPANQTPAEIAMYRAYFAWQSAYMPSLLDDINWIEAYKHGFEAGRVYAQQEQTSDDPLVA